MDSLCAVLFLWQTKVMRVKLEFMKRKFVFYFSFVCFIGVSFMANSIVLDKYTWSNRLLIVVTDKNENNLEKKVRNFFEQHACDIDDRNLKLLHFFLDDPTVLELPSSIKHHTGMWLLGYDGNIKAHSEDSQLLHDLFEIIDTMPMRKGEMKSGSRNCS